MAHVERSCVQLAGERQLQDRCLAIVQEMGQRVLRVEQLVALSRQTILQKTLRSGGDSDFSARMVDEQAERFGGRIQSIWIGSSTPQVLWNRVIWWARRVERCLDRQ